jgi:hypothetical protein
MFVIWSCDPSGRLQRPEQHGSSFGAWQAGLFFDAPFKLFTQPLDGAGGSRAFSLAGRQSVLTATPVENGSPGTCPSLQADLLRLPDHPHGSFGRAGVTRYGYTGALRKLMSCAPLDDL